MKLQTTIRKIEFPTHANGVVGCTVLVMLTPELEKIDCGGLGLDINEHIKEGKLPFIVGSKVEIEFNEKNEIAGYVISTETDDMTEIPTKCVSCGSETFNHKCVNYVGCLAHSVSPLLRLIRLTVGFLPTEALLMFIEKFPEGKLTHFSDLSLLLKTDPNTAFREKQWADARGWVIEKAVWSYLKQNKMPSSQFWFIAFGLEGSNKYTADPREVISGMPDKSIPHIVMYNLDRARQLVGLLDRWEIKEYVTKAH